jgi:hypothetical protein
VKQIERKKIMTGPTTATVQTLQASVQTLLVGTRQVTMSVYLQLDTVPAGELAGLT